MSKTEILAELPKLQPAELAEVQAKLDEIAGEVWVDDGELTDTDKSVLDVALAEYQKNPNAGSPWAETTNIRESLHPVGEPGVSKEG